MIAPSRGFVVSEADVKDFYDGLCGWLSIHPITTGGMLALILTALRVSLSETSRSFSYVCMEGLACGFLSMAFSHTAINMLNVDPSIGTLMGATAGFVGIERTRAFMIKLLDAWILKQKGGEHADK